MDTVRNTDFSARFPVANEGNSGKPAKTRESREPAESTQPFLFPGSDVQPERPRERDPEMRSASLQPAAFMKGDGVEMNFEGADVQTVAKTLLGDILQLNFVVDPRVQGNVTLASAGPISRKDVLPAFESVLKMQNAAIVRSGDLVKVVPMAEASWRWRHQCRDWGAGLRCFAGASALHLGFNSGEDGRKLYVASGRYPCRPVPKSAAGPGHDRGTPGRAGRGRDLRCGMAAESVGGRLSAEVDFAGNDDRRT